LASHAKLADAVAMGIIALSLALVVFLVEAHEVVNRPRRGAARR
jgi:hypothetical protein